MPASIRFESAEVTAPKLAVVEALSLLSTLARMLQTSTPTYTSRVSLLNLASRLSGSA